MNSFREIFFLETKRTLKIGTIGPLLIISFLALYFLQLGVNNYQRFRENKKAFLHFESLKVSQYLTYDLYGTYGMRILFTATPLNVFFFNSTTILDLTANIDAGERLNIYKSFKGRGLFTDSSRNFQDFSSIFFLLASFLVLYMGYESFIYKDYLRFITRLISPRDLFFPIVLSRVVILILFILLVVILSMIMLDLSEIQLSQNDYLYYMAFIGVMILVFIFFYALGTVAGSFSSKFSGFIMVMVFWFLTVFFIPGFINSIITSRAETFISQYQLELMKLRILMDFEIQALKKSGPVELSDPETARKIREQFWNRDYKEVQSSENILKERITSNIKLFQILSSFCPSSFYLSSGNEISSKGFKSYLSFFSYIQRLKAQFVKFIMDHKYIRALSGGKRGNLQSFIKKDENLYQSSNQLPHTFTLGLVICLIYIGGLFFISYHQFKRSLKL